MLHRQRHLWACPVKTSKLGHKFGRCHMRQSPDRDTDVKTPGARELWSGQAKKAQPWTNKVAKEQKKVHKEQKHGNYGPASQKKCTLALDQ